MRTPPIDPVENTPIQHHLEEIHRKHAGLHDGAVATYIPELAKANPDWFGICLVTTGGHVYEVGDSDVPFTIQSISKPFVYGIALEDHGRKEVFSKVGVEPTGDVFNAISLEPGTGRPRNPMINAGAIATAGLVQGKSMATRLQRILHTFSLCAGRQLSLDESVYRSESETGHRNRAIGHLLRNFDILTEPPEPVVDLYFKQCSIAVTCRDLATMAATLANRGINPVTGQQAIRGEYVESVLSVMASCGMYDYAGEWIYRVGMPAKSGVAGGIIAVLPGQLGIGIFSPRLDSHGNSVRGIKVCDDLSRHFDLHLFNSPHATRSVIRLKFTGSDVNSSCVRSLEESRLLRTHGTAIRVYQLQGNLVFSTSEVVIQNIIANEEGMEYLILDFKHVLVIDESACRLIYQLLLHFAEKKRKVIFTNIARRPALRRYIKLKLAHRFEEFFHSFDDDDLAFEWCENDLLSRYLPVHGPDRLVPPSEYELFAGLTAEEITVLTGLLQRKLYPKGAVMVQFGDDARELFLLARGTASVTVTLSSGGQKRLATFPAGTAFGEMAMIDRAPRSAVVTADTEVECDLFNVDDFERLDETHPRIKIKLLSNLSLSLSRKLRKANREISVFDY